MLSNELHVTPTYWISGLNLITNIGTWYLHPKMSVFTVFSGSGRIGFSHNSSQHQSQLLKMYLTCIPQNSNVRTKTRPCTSILSLFIWVFISLQVKQNVPLLGYPGRHTWNSDKLKQQQTSGRQTCSPHIRCRPLGYSVGRWRTTSSAPSRRSMPPSVWLVSQLVPDDYLRHCR